MSTFIYFVSSNKNKIHEVEKLLKVPMKSVDLELDEIQTTDLKSLLIHKIEEAYKKVKAPLIVEDTALYFDAWNELPGPLIKWFLKEMGNHILVQALSPFENKIARAVCGLGYTDGKVFQFFEGMVDGKIVPPRGSSGFGWDNIFQPKGTNKTFAEMLSEEKDQFSMRTQAINKLNQFLKNI